MYQSQPCSIN